MLSSNAGKRSRRDPWSVAEARGRLKNDTMEALRDLAELPRLERASICITLMRSKRRPKLEQCPRCLERALGGANIDSCCCYRPQDVGNIGGDPIKPILDALVWMEILPDDDHTHLVALTLMIEIVETIPEEGYVVTIQELIP